MPTERMGPPPGASPPMRMTASWLGSNDPTAYKSVARRCAPMASSPRILNRPTGTVQTLKLCKKPLSQVIIAPRAQASRRCETQATLAASRQAVLPFRSLDPFRALREPDRRRRDEERLFQLRTKNRQQTKNDHLTGKAPYRFESISLQGRVQCELPRTNLETKSAQTIPPPDRRSMRRRRLLMGALGALMLMGVARKVMLGKTGRFVRSFASLPAPATSQPNSSGRRAQRKPRCRSGHLYFLTESQAHELFAPLPRASRVGGNVPRWARPVVDMGR